MSNKVGRKSVASIAPVVPMVPPSNGHRPTVDIGPATLDVFAQALLLTDVGKAQIVTLLEAKGLLGTGGYRLLISAASLVPDDAKNAT